MGRVDLLDAVTATEHFKAKGLDLSPILAQPEAGPPTDRYCCRAQDHGLDRALDHRFLAACRPAIDHGTPVALELPITNVDRTVGTLLGYEITTRHGGAGLADDTITLTFRGSAGQSFGAFVPRGVTLRLIGDANDYLAKGLVGWARGAAPRRSLALRGRGADHRRQRHPLRGHRRRVLRARAGGGALLRAQLGAPRLWWKGWETTAVST